MVADTGLRCGTTATREGEGEGDGESVETKIGTGAEPMFGFTD
jgi:hypothetical protein